MSEMIMMMKRKGTWEKISMRRCMPRSNMPPKYPIIIPKVMPDEVHDGQVEDGGFHVDLKASVQVGQDVRPLGVGAQQVAALEGRRRVVEDAADFVFIRLFQEILLGAGAVVVFRHNLVVLVRGAVHFRPVLQPSGGAVHLFSLAEFVADVRQGFFILMQAGGKAGVRLSIGFADQALFIHDQRFRARIGGIPVGS